MIHDDVIEWPNGEGFTPCTREYADKMMARDAIFDANIDEGSTEDLCPEDYERWHQLDSELCQMQMAGHLGKSERYARPTPHFPLRGVLSRRAPN